MAEETQYTANTGMVTISTANSNLDGTGTLGTVITAASNGTIVKTVTIQATGNITQGMVRLFLYDGTNTKLIAEVEIPAVNCTGQDPAFGITIPVDYALEAGSSLKASTEKGESFNVIAEGLDWTYYTTSVRPESSKYTGNTGMATISTANSNRDGTGTMGTVITGASNGTQIERISVKAQVNTNAGMVRLFLYDGTNTKLFKEYKVDPVTKSATANSFSLVDDFDGKGFAIETNWSVKAATENGESFNVIAEGLDWTYPA